jgi:hypothetical protein
VARAIVSEYGLLVVAALADATANSEVSKAAIAAIHRPCLMINCIAPLSNSAAHPPLRLRTPSGITREPQTATDV